jgi:hypothetical protein
MTGKRQKQRPSRINRRLATCHTSNNSSSNSQQQPATASNSNSQQQQQPATATATTASNGATWIQLNGN